MLLIKQYYFFNYIIILFVSLVLLLLCDSTNCIRKSCPSLTPAKGMVLSCFRRNNHHRQQLQHYYQSYLNSSIASLELSSKEKLKFSTMTSNDNCSISTSYLPGTVAYFKCLPYFTTRENTEAGGFLKCTRMGTWRHQNRFNNFSCHLRADGWINKLIDENRVVIFSKSFCIYCTRVKELFRSLGVHYHAIELDYFDSARQAMIRDALWKKTGMKSWPNIFINRQHLGGFDKTLYGYQDGSLQRLLNLNNNRNNQ